MCRTIDYDEYSKSAYSCYNGQKLIFNCKMLYTDLFCPGRLFQIVVLYSKIEALPLAFAIRAVFASSDPMFLLYSCAKSVNLSNK